MVKKKKWYKNEWVIPIIIISVIVIFLSNSFYQSYKIVNDAQEIKQQKEQEEQQQNVFNEFTLKSNKFVSCWKEFQAFGEEINSLSSNTLLNMEHKAKQCKVLLSDYLNFLEQYKEVLKPALIETDYDGLMENSRIQLKGIDEVILLIQTTQAEFNKAEEVAKTSKEMNPACPDFSNFDFDFGTPSAYPETVKAFFYDSNDLKQFGDIQGWSVSGGQSLGLGDYGVTCYKGSNVGENANYYYCGKHNWASFNGQYLTKDLDGNILSKYEVNLLLVFNSEGEYVETIC
jgi:hypothetical protein